jgi:Na+-driven multidrug efflux pump
LIIIVPPLALLAIQAAQSLPRWLSFVLAMASTFQSLVMAAGHGNTLTASLATLWKRHGRLLWMVRLDDMNIPGSWLALALTWVIAAALLLWIWLPAFRPADGLAKRPQSAR